MDGVPVAISRLQSLCTYCYYVYDQVISDFVCTLYLWCALLHQADVGVCVSKHGVLIITIVQRDGNKGCAVEDGLWWLRRQGVVLETHIRRGLSREHT